MALVAVAMSSCGKKEEPAAVKPDPAPVVADIRIILKTNKGDIKATLFATKAPVTVASFLNLARRNFYDGLAFHRVVEGFVVQGGDPDGDGKGGPGYFLPNEIAPGLRHDKKGVLSMARKSKPDTAGSQFFITLAPAPHLDEGYSIFGEVTEGLEVVDQVEVGDKIVAIETLDPADALFKAQAGNLVEWNRILDQRSNQ